MNFLLAVQFLTRLPVEIKSNIDLTDMARSMSYFPIVGFFIGGIIAVSYFLLSFVFSEQICNIFILAILIFITGNLHLDGLMDSADGLFSGKPREQMLEIMRDSRVGSNGVIAGILVILIKFLLLGEIVHEFKYAALVIMPVLGRWAQVYGARFYSYARKGGGAGDFTVFVGNREFIWASFLTVLPAILLFGWIGFVLLASVLIVTFLLTRYVSKKINGMTGDTLGGITECVEVFALLVLQFVQFKVSYLHFIDF